MKPLGKALVYTLIAIFFIATGAFIGVRLSKPAFNDRVLVPEISFKSQGHSIKLDKFKGEYTFALTYNIDQDSVDMYNNNVGDVGYLEITVKGDNDILIYGANSLDDLDTNNIGACHNSNEDGHNVCTYSFDTADSTIYNYYKLQTDGKADVRIIFIFK